ncbi:MAG: hypothetical protein K0B08_07400 [Bacteroidales bacterium]|nr:hypothetical protein [Bacteroidales bacterium]
MKKRYRQSELDENQPNHYKWGIFYYNPDDTRTILPKRIKWAGWTLNFASPFTYMIILGFIIVVVLLEYFFK